MLKEWMISYVKSKDANFKNIEKMDEKENSIIVTHISASIGSGFKKQVVPKIATYIAQDILQTENKDIIPDTIIITLNTKKNVNYLVDHFEEFAKNETLRIIFANPNINETWQIHPFRHARLLKMMEANLKQSIMSLFEPVPEYIA
jgi:hypothetical protein